MPESVLPRKNVHRTLMLLVLASLINSGLVVGNFNPKLKQFTTFIAPYIFVFEMALMIKRWNKFKFSGIFWSMDCHASQNLKMALTYYWSSFDEVSILLIYIKLLLRYVITNVWR